jgi:hypothetical protein
MKNAIKPMLSLVFLMGIIVFLVGCSRQPIQLAQGWTPPVRVTDSQEGESAGVDLYKWRDTIMLLQERYDWSAKSSTRSIMIRSSDQSNSWTRLPFPDTSRGYAYPALDPTNGRIMFEQGRVENDQVMMSAIIVRVTGNGEIQVEYERKWMVDKKSFFGETRLNAGLTEYNEPGQRAWPKLGSGIIDGTDLYIPFCVDGFTYVNKYTSARGPYNNGVFHSADSGVTWQIEPISDTKSFPLTVSRTKGYYYYFAYRHGEVNQGMELWFSRKSVKGGSWDAPKVKTQSFEDRRGGGVLVEDDTVHLCWLDNRHEKWRPRIETPPGLGNYEVVYSRRKDSDATWREDVILSSGLLFSYSPSMSVEGDRIVVAWRSGKSNQPRRSDDIYYTTSKDGGKTWAKPLKVTDRAKDGITSGEPQVAVQNGVIHLFYVQGKENRYLSHQEPWPIYYQQRPFPD